MAVTLTERAARHVAAYLSRRGKGVGVRLAVHTTGCSGMAYKLEFADAADPADARFESNGVTVLVDPRSLAYRRHGARFRARGPQRGIQVQQSQ